MKFFFKMGSELGQTSCNPLLITHSLMCPFDVTANGRFPLKALDCAIRSDSIEVLRSRTLVSSARAFINGARDSDTKRTGQIH